MLHPKLIAITDPLDQLMDILFPKELKPPEDDLQRFFDRIDQDAPTFSSLLEQTRPSPTQQAADLLCAGTKRTYSQMQFMETSGSDQDPLQPPQAPVATVDATSGLGQDKSPAVQLIEEFLKTAPRHKHDLQTTINPLEWMRNKIKSFGERNPQTIPLETDQDLTALLEDLGSKHDGEHADFVLDRTPVGDRVSSTFFNVNITSNSKINLLGIIMLLEGGFSLESCQDYALLYAIQALLRHSPGTCKFARKSGNGQLKHNRMCIQPHHYKTDLEKLRASLEAYQDHTPQQGNRV